FIAINPLHVFFSKFPMSEMGALAFMSSALYCLLRYYRNTVNGKRYACYLFLSAGLIGCFAFTRMTLTVYMPFFYMLSVLTILRIKDPMTKRQLLWYFFSIY